MRQLLRRFRGDQRGEGVTEYALLIAVLAICLIGVIQSMREQVGGLLGTAAADVEQSSGTGYGASGSGGGGSPRGFPGPTYGGGAPPVDEAGEEPDSAAADSAGGRFTNLGAR